jgi:hypothetical protein
MSRDFRDLLAEFNARNIELAEVSKIPCLNTGAIMKNWITAFAVMTVAMAPNLL